MSAKFTLLQIRRPRCSKMYSASAISQPVRFDKSFASRRISLSALLDMLPSYRRKRIRPARPRTTTPRARDPPRQPDDAAYHESPLAFPPRIAAFSRPGPALWSRRPRAMTTLEPRRPAPRIQRATNLPGRKSERSDPRTEESRRAAPSWQSERNTITAPAEPEDLREPRTNMRSPVAGDASSVRSCRATQRLPPTPARSAPLAPDPSARTPRTRFARTRECTKSPVTHQTLPSSPVPLTETSGAKGRLAPLPDHYTDATIPFRIDPPIQASL